MEGNEIVIDGKRRAGTISPRSQGMDAYGHPEPKTGS